MKIPFSYQTRFFRPVLAGVILAHGGLLMASWGGSPLPAAGLQTAQTSMEIVIVEEPDALSGQGRVAEVLAAGEEAATLPVEMPAAEPEPRPVLEQGVVRAAEPDYLLNPPPVYPDSARERGWQGTVTLEVQVSSKGLPDQVTVFRSSGYRILDQAAEKAVRRWKFRPASVAGFPLSTRVKVPVRFILEKNL